MFFRIELLNKFSQGRFSESWLAATCPTLFRRNYRKNHVVKISVRNICENIQEMWNTNSDQVNERLSLFLAAQLLYGTVCIHQQQVQFLYETTLELFCLERVLTKLVRTNVQREDATNIKNPRRKYVLKCPTQKNQQMESNFLMEDYGLVVCQSQQNDCAKEILEKSVEELLQGPDVVSVPNASITLIEEPITGPSHDGATDELAEEPQIFNGPEYLEFMNFDEEVQSAKRAKLHETTSSVILEVPLEKPAKTLCYSNLNLHESSLDLINRVNRSATPMMTNSFDNFYQQINTGSTPMRDRNQPDPILDHFSTQSKQQHTIVAENTVESVVEPVQPTALEQSEDIARPKTIIRGKNCKKRLIIDSSIEITDKCFYSHIQNYTSTLRALHPSNDIISLWKLKLERDLFHMVGNKILAIPLCNYYKSRLVTKPMLVDTDIFDGLLNPFEVTPPHSKHRGRKRTHDDRIVKTVEPVPIITMENPLPIETEVNLPSMTMIELPLPMEPEINMEPPLIELPTMETIEIPSLFPVDMSGLTDFMAKEQFGKTKIYRHLKVLWSLNVHPIGMRTLCAKLKQRKYVAMVFYSLMCLQKEAKIKLICNLNDREIYHIQSVD